MNATQEVKEFLNGLNETPIFGKNLVSFIRKDSDAIRQNVTDQILTRQVKLDCNWNSYTLSNVDVYYDEDALTFVDRLELFGIRSHIPPVRSGDHAIVVVYRYTSFDAYGGDVDSVNAFRVVLQQGNGVLKNRRIVVYS